MQSGRSRLIEALDISSGIPDNILIDADGRIVDRWVGYRDEADWTERIRKLMKADP